MCPLFVFDGEGTTALYHQARWLVLIPDPNLASRPDLSMTTRVA
jgi:hypothetical protein